MTRMLMVAAGVLGCVSVVPAAEKIVKETMISEGATRTYYLFVPEGAKDKPSPLIILLHGSGRDGKILVEHWQSLAKQEGIVLAGPDASVREGWGMRDDGPLFLRHLREAIEEKHSIDSRRVYIFGHSAGANHGLRMAILESEYFAAVAVHAGTLAADIVPFLPRAPRKIPIAIWVGTNDSFFPLRPVRDSRDALNEQGFNAELTEIVGHTHNYYGSSSGINKSAWAFLKDKHLEHDTQYPDYTILR
jgi:poly(3-hydroxybutyrate) depolymerase